MIGQAGALLRPWPTSNDGGRGPFPQLRVVGLGECGTRAVRSLNRLLRGWTAYFRLGVSFAAFSYLRSCVWARVIAWIRRKHRR